MTINLFLYKIKTDFKYIFLLTKDVTMHSSSLFQSSPAFKNIQEALDTVTSYFSDLLRLKSPDLYAHSVRVSNYAGATAI